MVRKEMSFSADSLPYMIQEKLNSVKFCGCGSPCFTHSIPYTKSIKLTTNALCVSYDEYLLSTKATVKVVGYLCSAACHELWTKNPNTLFTSKQKKRPLETPTG